MRLPRDATLVFPTPSFSLYTPVIPAKTGIQIVEAKLAIRNQV